MALGRPRSAIAALACYMLFFSPAFLDAQLAVETLEVVLVPASAPVATFVIRNEGDEVVQAAVDFEDWDRDDRGLNRFYAPGTIGGSCGARVRVFPASLRLEPKESGTVRVSLAPADTATTACWSVVFFTPLRAPSAASRQLAFNVRTGVKIYVEPSLLSREGSVDGMTIEPHAADDPHGIAVDSSRKDVVISFRNTGGLQLRLEGALEIRREDNSLVQKLELLETPVLPGARRLYPVELPRLPRGRYVLLALIDFGGSEIAAGQLEYEVR